MNQEVPNPLVQEDAGMLMQKVPANEIEILRLGRGLNRQGEVATALGCAVVAQAFVLGNRFAGRFDFWQLIHVAGSVLS